MNKIEAHIAEFCSNHQLARYFVACSGGVDSIVLLHILHKLGKTVSAVHVNYMLRGEDSEKDQEIVEQTCQTLGIPCHVKRADLNAILEKTGGNLQDQARKVRYAYFKQFTVKENFYLVLGHHADDQVETFFLNISRGGGVMGLAGMLPQNGTVLRPLLPFTKKEIIDYAQQENITWREDLSNTKSDYNRNKLRNLILPSLKDQFPDLNEQVLTLVNAFQSTQTHLEEKIRHLISQNKTDQLSFTDFQKMDEFERIEFLRQLEIPVQLEQAWSKLDGSQKGKIVAVSEGPYERIVAESDAFVFVRRNATKRNPELKMEMVSDLPNLFTKDVIYLNPDKIKGILQLRSWQLGDRIKPIGMKGSKLISDVLTDAKVPNSERLEQLVLCDDEKILWCVGHTVSREALANNQSEKLKLWVQ
jgi:tRNA(Ile)-lysidine synthase